MTVALKNIAKLKNLVILQCFADFFVKNCGACVLSYSGKMQNIVVSFRPLARVMSAFVMIVCTTLVTFQPSWADQSQMKLRDDFEGESFDPQGGLYFKNNEEQKAGSHLIQKNVFRSGQKGLALSVKPRCEANQHGCSERAEVWEKTDILAGYDKTVWYALSMKLDDPVPLASHRYVVAQWKRQIKPDAKVDYSPFLAIRIIQGNFALTIDTDEMPSRARSADDAALSCAKNEAPAMQRRSAQQTRLLVATSADAEPESFKSFNSCAAGLSIIQRSGQLPKARPEWNDFVFKVKPGPTGDGELEVFVNGTWIVSAKGRIGHAGPSLGLHQYFKFGPYRDGGLKDNWTVFYDDFRRGPRCDDVATEAVCNQIKNP